jgi:hypothetical protein
MVSKGDCMSHSTLWFIGSNNYDFTKWEGSLNQSFNTWGRDAIVVGD